MARLLLGVALVATKTAALLMLPLMGFGYLFFFASHTPLTHAYFVVTAVALLLTLAIGPGFAEGKAFQRLFLGVALVDSGLSGWQIAEHLGVSEGPDYPAAVLDVGVTLVIWVAFLAFRGLTRLR